MADKTEEEFRSMKEEMTGDIYIGGGETDAMNQIAAVAVNSRRHIRESIITCTAATHRM